MQTTQKLFASGKLTVPAQIRRVYDIEDGNLVETDVRPVEGESDDG